MLSKKFFDQDAQVLAMSLLGKVIRLRRDDLWLSVQIIETEAYYQSEKGSHSSKGYTEKRKALFMSPGTIYMYYSRGGDSMNVTAGGRGNAVLIKSGVPYLEEKNARQCLAVMQQLNPRKYSSEPREPSTLCSGQALLCRSLGLKVKEWDQKQFSRKKFYVEDVDYTPERIARTARLGIPKGRDEHLLYRFVDVNFSDYCTRRLSRESIKQAVARHE